jgi:hypothetical protein
MELFKMIQRRDSLVDEPVNRRAYVRHLGPDFVNMIHGSIKVRQRAIS